MPLARRIRYAPTSQRLPAPSPCCFPDDAVVEVRIPKTAREGTVSGYFDDHEALARSVAARNGDIAVYWTLNPVVPALLARCANRVRNWAGALTKDEDILRRVWLLIDCDPVRPAEISSSDVEHEAAHRARRIRRALTKEGWPDPLFADSGNGAHLLYLIDLPNDGATTALLKGVLTALARRFNDGEVKIDQAVYNASRICKAYGTVSRKGDDMPDHTHRLSCLIDVPPGLVPVTPELLERLAATDAPPPRPEAPSPRGHRFDIEEWIRRHGPHRARASRIRRRPQVGAGRVPL